MRYDTLYLWYLADPAAPRYVGVLQLVAAGKGVSLRYGQEWLETGFPLSEDLPLIDTEHMPPGRLAGTRGPSARSMTRARIAGARKSSASWTSRSAPR